VGRVKIFQKMKIVYGNNVFKFLKTARFYLKTGFFLLKTKKNVLLKYNVF